MADEPKELLVHPDHQFGTFANAVRVVEEVGPDCFLDFIVYSGQERKGVVVSRLRVRKEFLPAIQSTLDQAIKEFMSPQEVHIH